MIEDDIKKVMDNLQILKNTYDIIRFVDPLRKNVINFTEGTENELNSNCYDFWTRDSICNNCISIRAFYQNETFIKVEYNPKNIFMITAIPIELNDRRIVIELLKDVTNSMFFVDDDNKNLAQIHSSIENMNNLVIKDDLTNLYNKRYVGERLPVELINAAIKNKNVSVIMTDIDFFKKVNDTYGHLAGDYTIKRFAEIISSCVKKGIDWIARFGGEEFLICVPETTHQQALEIAKRMRKAVEAATIDFEGNSFKITASFGVCNISPNEINQMEEIIEIADKKLYEAKSNGRNIVKG